MFCWTQNVLYGKKNNTFLLFVFSRCCRGFVSSFLNRPHTSQSWRFSVQALNMLKCDWCGITSNPIGSNGTCYCNKKREKKLFTIFDLFCNVLIYFSRFYLTLFQCYCFFCFVFYLKRSKNCCSSASDFIWVTITSTACSVVVRFWSAVQSLSLFTRWHLALREKLQSMVTALEYL